jgi:hypothetical protein
MRPQGATLGVTPKHRSPAIDPWGGNTMQLHRLTLSVLSALVLAAPLAHADDRLVPKQLAGAPDDFAAMAPADVADATIHSKSALVPIRMSADKHGRRVWQGTLPVSGGSARFLVFAGDAGGWRIEAISPDGTTIKSGNELARSAKRGEFGLEEDRHAADFYTLDHLQDGNWTLRIEAKGGDANDGFLLIEGDAAIELASYQTHKRQLIGERVGLTAMLTAADAKAGTLLGNAAGRIDRARLRVTSPDGTDTMVPMFDDGRHADGMAGDGLFGGDFLAASAGTYLAQVSVQGVDRGGHALLRTAEHVVPIVEASIQLADSKTSGSASPGNRLTIDIPVTAQKRGQHYRAYAQVWGTDKRGNATAVAWLGGMATPADGKLSLGFDERWIARAGVRAPFELRNLRIEDPDHFVTVASAERLALALPAIRTKLKPGDVVIDDQMRMGPRPAAAAVAKGVGTRLLLVHGYCSGGVWPAGHFSGASTFLDVNQNRTHDQFAQRIKTFGDTWNSYGIVAHSQGGAAALHLFNYYWSGLDNATGSRLIQSVGTPYKGTNLAGILATLGSWFGVGCGTNDNLSYGGASSWLAGIPNTSRAKVNYYTTAFRTTNWWTNDYCNFATDLVLSDPEDGTTEQVNGQLPGATNRGHTAGQCHTSGMRDPAQTQDAGRNSTMNSNAAR